MKTFTTLDSDSLVTATGGLSIPPSTGPTFPPPMLPRPTTPWPLPPTQPRPGAPSPFDLLKADK